MHLKRQAITKKVPIARKGNKFVARALSHHDKSVPVVIAVRDMLKLAKTTKEVKKMIHDKALKINNKVVKNHKESIKLFNIFEAGKLYTLTLLPTKRFTLKETKEHKRLCNVKSKKLLNKGKIQINLHDGTNILADNKIKVHDSIYLNDKNKITSHVKFDKGAEIFVVKGKYAGQGGKISAINRKQVTIKLKDKEVTLPASNVFVI